jgi:hypothetical protein
MRTLGFCIAGSIAAVLMVDYGAAGGRLTGAVQSSSSEQTVVRERKGDRLQVATLTLGRQVGPITVDAPQPAPAAKHPPADYKPALLRGCEPALSPLTGTALTGLHARCFADAGKPMRPAA